MTHAATQGATGRAADTGTDGRAGATAQAITDQRATGRTQATTDGRLGPAAFARPGRTACRTGNTRADCRTGTATELLPDHIAQRAAKPATNGCSAIAGHSALSQQKSHNQGR
ncbi:hypothetical protein BK644_25030 [Pseudomonas protegens]|nr:hypothetical protein BK644_25030 [Pseudomonas protegens]